MMAGHCHGAIRKSSFTKASGKSCKWRKTGKWEDKRRGRTASRAPLGWDKTTWLRALAWPGSTGFHWFVLKVEINLQEIEYIFSVILAYMVNSLEHFPGLSLYLPIANLYTH